MKSTFVQVRPVALMPDEPSIDRDTEWRKFDIHKNSLASAGKSQARFVATLLAFLALLWGWHYMQPTELSLEFFGARMHAAGLWTIAPAVLTVLALALIGAMNIMGPIWKRLRICTDRLHEIFFWTDLDPNKTLLDFFTHLKVWPEGAVEAYTVPREEKRHRIAVFSYPALLMFATFTTAVADYPGASRWYRLYVYGCVVVQAVFSFRVWYRAICRFFGWRKEQVEI